MILQLFKEKIPAVKKWIFELLTKYDENKISVSNFNFNFLRRYFPTTFLDNTFVVCIDKCPFPPLKALGLDNIIPFEFDNIVGITFWDTFFISKGNEHIEPLFFHELVHIAQWKYIDIDSLLISYALGLLEYGYENNPFEKMAFQHQFNFENFHKPYDVVESVRKELEKEPIKTILYEAGLISKF